MLYLLAVLWFYIIECQDLEPKVKRGQSAMITPSLLPFFHNPGNHRRALAYGSRLLAEYSTVRVISGADSASELCCVEGKVKESKFLLVSGQGVMDASCLLAQTLNQKLNLAPPANPNLL